eukprot:jgi/Mesvir1/27870/Mv12695-RA.1
MLRKPRFLSPENGNFPALEAVIAGLRPCAAHVARYQQAIPKHVGGTNGVESWTCPEPKYLPPAYLYTLAGPLQLILLTSSKFPITLTSAVHCKACIAQKRFIHVDEVLNLHALSGTPWLTPEGDLSFQVTTLVTTGQPPPPWLHQWLPWLFLLPPRQVSPAGPELLWEGTSTWVVKNVVKKVVKKEKVSEPPAPEDTPLPARNDAREEKGSSGENSPTWASLTKDGGKPPSSAPLDLPPSGTLDRKESLDRKDSLDLKLSLDRYGSLDAKESLSVDSSCDLGGMGGALDRSDSTEGNAHGGVTESNVHGGPTEEGWLETSINNLPIPVRAHAAGADVALLVPAHATRDDIRHVPLPLARATGAGEEKAEPPAGEDSVDLAVGPYSALTGADGPNSALEIGGGPDPALNRTNGPNDHAAETSPEEKAANAWSRLQAVVVGSPRVGQPVGDGPFSDSPRGGRFSRLQVAVPESCQPEIVALDPPQWALDPVMFDTGAESSAGSPRFNLFGKQAQGGGKGGVGLGVTDAGTGQGAESTPLAKPTWLAGKDRATGGGGVRLAIPVEVTRAWLSSLEPRSAHGASAQGAMAAAWGGHAGGYGGGDAYDAADQSRLRVSLDGSLEDALSQFSDEATMVLASAGALELLTSAGAHHTGPPRGPARAANGGGGGSTDAHGGELSAGDKGEGEGELSPPLSLARWCLELVLEPWLPSRLDNLLILGGIAATLAGKMTRAAAALQATSQGPGYSSPLGAARGGQRGPGGDAFGADPAHGHGLVMEVEFLHRDPLPRMFQVRTSRGARVERWGSYFAFALHAAPAPPGRGGTWGGSLVAASGGQGGEGGEGTSGKSRTGGHPSSWGAARDPGADGSDPTEGLGLAAALASVAGSTVGGSEASRGPGTGQGVAPAAVMGRLLVCTSREALDLLAVKTAARLGGAPGACPSAAADTPDPYSNNPDHTNSQYGGYNGAAVEYSNPSWADGSTDHASASHGGPPGRMGEMASGRMGDLSSTGKTRRRRRSSNLSVGATAYAGPSGGGGETPTAQARPAPWQGDEETPWLAHGGAITRGGFAALGPTLWEVAHRPPPRPPLSLVTNRSAYAACRGPGSPWRQAPIPTAVAEWQLDSPLRAFSPAFGPASPLCQVASPHGPVPPAFGPTVYGPVSPRAQVASPHGGPLSPHNQPPSPHDPLFPLGNRLSPHHGPLSPTSSTMPPFALPGPAGPWQAASAQDAAVPGAGDLSAGGDVPPMGDAALQGGALEGSLARMGPGADALHRQRSAPDLKVPPPLTSPTYSARSEVAGEGSGMGHVRRVSSGRRKSGLLPGPRRSLDQHSAPGDPSEVLSIPASPAMSMYSERSARSGVSSSSRRAGSVMSDGRPRSKRRSSSKGSSGGAPVEAEPAWLKAKAWEVEAEGGGGGGGVLAATG